MKLFYFRDMLIALFKLLDLHYIQLLNFITIFRYCHVILHNIIIYINPISTSNKIFDILNKGLNEMFKAL